MFALDFQYIPANKKNKLMNSLNYSEQSTKVVFFRFSIYLCKLFCFFVFKAHMSQLRMLFSQDGVNITCEVGPKNQWCFLPKRGFLKLQLLMFLSLLNFCNAGFPILLQLTTTYVTNI